MAKNAHQKLKLLYLAKILTEKTDENNRLSMDELIAALAQHGIEAERKSIYDDISALQDFGLDILMQRGRNGGYYLASRDFELPELKLLVDAVQCSRFITEKKSLELIHKVEALASEPQARALQRQVYVAGRVKTMNEGIYYSIDRLHEAISAGTQISFRYFEWAIDYSAQPPIQKRFRKDGAAYRISPWALTWDDENYYLVGFDSAAGQIRHYRVDKMEQLQVLPEPREGRQHFENSFDIAAYSRKMFGMFSGEEKNVTLLCENRFIGVIRDRFGADVMLRRHSDTHFCISVTVAVSPQFFSWVFGLGGAVTIASPTEVREAFQKQIRSMLE